MSRKRKKIRNGSGTGRGTGRGGGSVKPRAGRGGRASGSRRAARAGRRFARPSLRRLVSDDRPEGAATPAAGSGDLLRRLPAAAVLIPALLWVVFRPSPAPLAAVVGLVSLAALREVFALQRAAGGRPLAAFGYVMALALHAAAYAERAGALGAPGTLALLTVLVAGSLVAWMPRGADTRTPGDIAGTVFAVLYAGFLPTFLVRVAGLPEGPRWMVVLLALTWVNDTGAYAWGRAIGGAKLWPAVSPNKTWAGFWGGLVTTTALALVLRSAWSGPGSLYILPDAPGLAMIAWLAPLVCVAATLGDLAESMIKRAAGAKDSGAFLPGHGGVLDKIDALLLTAPVVWFAARLAA